MTGRGRPDAKVELVVEAAFEEDGIVIGAGDP
jgi:hypothetical protein